MPVKESIIEFINSENISIREFERRCGLSNGYVKGIKHSILPAKMRSISLQFPQLNTGWLLTGEGEMLIENREKSHKIDERSADLRKIIALLEDKADRLERENSLLRHENDSLKKELAAVAIAQTANVG